LISRDPNLGCCCLGAHKSGRRREEIRNMLHVGCEVSNGQERMSSSFLGVAAGVGYEIKLCGGHSACSPRDCVFGTLRGETSRTTRCCKPV
jgi:hypothetical protein